MHRRIRSVMVGLAAVSLAVPIGVFVVAGASSAAPLPSLPPIPSENQMYSLLPVTMPDSDPWYADPPNLAQYRDGDIVRSRDVQSYALGIPIPVFTRQLLYRSTDAHNAPLVTATTVLVPGIPWVGPRQRPLISYQEAIDSMGTQCNPSFTMRAGLQKEIALIGQFLEAGMAVTLSDFDGKRNTILSPAEGHMVLDGIRAAQRAGLGLENSPIGLWGYSGGGNATTSTAEQHHSYAPELNIKAAAAGGVPGDKVGIGPYAMSGRQFQANFTGWLAIIGLSRTYPELVSLSDYLTPDGMAIAHDIEGRCLYSTWVDTALRPVASYLKNPDAVNDPRVHHALELESFGHPDALPDMPMLMWHSTTDQLLPEEMVIDPVIRKYCAAGVNVRFLRVPASEHISAEIVPEVGTVAWLTAAVAGLTVGGSTC